MTVETKYSGITILQGDSVTLSCTPTKLDIPLQWSYDGNNISNSAHFQLTPSFLNHDLIISHATESDSGNYVCAFKLKDKVVDQQTIVLTVVPSKYGYNMFC